MSANVMDTPGALASGVAAETAMPPAPLLELRGVSKRFVKSVSYTHLTLPTKLEV